MSSLLPSVNAGAACGLAWVSAVPSCYLDSALVCMLGPGQTYNPWRTLVTKPEPCRSLQSQHAEQAAQLRAVLRQDWSRAHGNAAERNAAHRESKKENRSGDEIRDADERHAYRTFCLLRSLFPHEYVQGVENDPAVVVGHVAQLLFYGCEPHLRCSITKRRGDEGPVFSTSRSDQRSTPVFTVALHDDDEESGTQSLAHMFFDDHALRPQFLGVTSDQFHTYRHCEFLLPPPPFVCLYVNRFFGRHQDDIRHAPLRVEPTLRVPTSRGTFQEYTLVSVALYHSRHWTAMFRWDDVAEGALHDDSACGQWLSYDDLRGSGVRYTPVVASTYDELLTEYVRSHGSLFMYFATPAAEVGASPSPDEWETLRRDNARMRSELWALHWRIESLKSLVS